MKGLIWLTWRQHRWPILVSAAVTAGLAVWMLITASELADMAKQCVTVSCGHNKLNPTASNATYQMNTVTFLPVLIAVFWGVPLLAREFEQRTLPLAWSQDVSRQRWLFGKTTVLTLLVAAMGAVLAGCVEHVAHEYRAYTGESLFEGTAFQAGGWLPLTLALGWLAFGIAAGAATRRVLPAIAVVAGAWIGRMILMPRIRPHLMTPLSSTGLISDAVHLKQQPTSRAQALAQAQAEASQGMHIQPNILSLDNGNASFVDSHGGQHSVHQVVDMWCPQLLGDTDNGQLDCLKQHDIVGTLSQYQPASRLGTFHVIENCANLTLFVLSLVLAWWCVRRTRTTTV